MSNYFYSKIVRAERIILYVSGLYYATLCNSTHKSEMGNKKRLNSIM